MAGAGPRGMLRGSLNRLEGRELEGIHAGPTPGARAALIALAACALLGLVSCAGIKKTLDGPPLPIPSGATRVDVLLDEYTITMPASIHAGSIAFVIKNKGDYDHNFRITGDAVDQKLGADLKTGDVVVLTLELKPGSYTIIDPVQDFATVGMKRDLTVTP